MITPANTSSTRKVARSPSNNIMNNEYQFRSLDRTLAMRYMQALREGRIRGETPLNLPKLTTLTYRPRMDLFDISSSPVVAAVLELPGLKKQDINLRVEQGQLVVSGERCMHVPAVLQETSGGSVKAEPRGERGTSNHSSVYHTPTQELKYGKYIRVIPLPAGTMPSQINASLGEGLLTVTWPRGPGMAASDVASDMSISLHSAPKSTMDNREEAALARATSMMHMDAN
ncbi:hypothetical protein BDN71DRAFT_995764 [Pleurotus eryngii]|uniref:SHSP domain-containing protein n=1 Tax=Pleurotus eryngii TaxID=5323 RepID=A0A9P5ZX76_PLEER|nr:hypothetical protein BDN71DRAFT_995764 [Pleurotus eryngii]